MTNDPTARVLQLLSLLQTHRLWSGPALAQRLEVTDRTLRRDIDRLRTLGYAVDAVPGPEGGYRLAPGKHLPPLLFEDEEAVALAVGLRAAAGEAIEGIEEAALRALAKLDHVLPGPLRRRTQAIASNLATVRWDGGRWGDDTEGRVDVDVLAVLGQACRDHEEVRFHYRRRDGEATDRLVQPHHLVSLDRRWYLLAFDVRRNDWRTFRIDRADTLRLAGARFEPRPVPGGDPGAFVTRALGSMPQPFSAVVAFDAPLDQVEAALPWPDENLEAIGRDRCGTTVRAASEEALVSRLVFVGRIAPMEVDAPSAVLESLRVLGQRLAAV